MHEDFLADLRLPNVVQDSGLSVGMGGPNRAQRVLDKTRAQQVEMERRYLNQQNQKKSIENIYLSNGKSISYDASR